MYSRPGISRIEHALSSRMTVLKGGKLGLLLHSTALQAQMLLLMSWYAACHQNKIPGSCHLVVL